MALLDVLARQRVCAQAMRQPELGPLPGMTKADLQAAVNATDDWIDSAQGALAPLIGYNAALPLPARTAMTTQQKTLLFCWVAMRRAGLFRTQEDA